MCMQEELKNCTICQLLVWAIHRKIRPLVSMPEDSCSRSSGIRYKNTVFSLKGTCVIKKIRKFELPSSNTFRVSSKNTMGMGEVVILIQLSGLRLYLKTSYSSRTSSGLSSFSSNRCRTNSSNPSKLKINFK